jgi:NAD(P)-dependent dehydrogenase (short-subunit alcohol dehydrogenase family)
MAFNDLAGRHILVTGASSGLGAHFGRVLAAAGAVVTLTARREQALAELAGEIGGTCRYTVMDVTDAASIEAAFDRAEALAGPVVGLVNNAGVTVTKPVLELEAPDWDRVLDTDLRGVWLVAQAAARRLVQHGIGGSVVNIASILGLRVAGGLAPYAAAKAGVVQLTKALALEWAQHEIRVNALAPGYIETDINRDFFATEAGKALVKRIPQRRLGRAEDLDGPLLLLLSDAGAYMTGSVIAVDGGHLVSSL